MPPSLYEHLLALRKRCSLIFEATPKNAGAEAERLAALAERGVFEEPRFEYDADPAPARVDLLLQLEELARAIPTEEHALGERARELLLEAELAGQVGRAHFGAYADVRFTVSAASKRCAAALANEWIDEGDTEPGPTYPTDGAHPEALFPRLTALVRLHSPYHKVVLRHGMTALAATGDEYVYVSSGRHLSSREAERVAVHEVFGHVIPRVRAVLEHDDLGRLGTARGEDTQEGYALFCEERAGLLHEARKRELAERHLACAWMEEGAPFPSVVEALVSEHGTPAPRAVRIAARAFRGSTGRGKGLGRERVYLPYYCAVKAHLERCPKDETRLTRGQRSLDELAPEEA